MDENADLRLTIETARKNKNWARRCYAYELAMEYFSLLEPDCYELCSYCDSIPEFLEEKNECCLIRALGAVKVFISRCVDAPSIARTVTKAIIDKLFFSASTKIREIATDIILDFIEWEACNGVLKELMTGALKYDGVRSDECIRVMRYALLDFGPHVVSVYKLIDFIAVLVRNKSFLSINDECSQLLIVIYKCLGAQVRVHLTHILDPNYISAIEDSYEEMRNIPIYHCRFVRYSKDNSSSLRESDEEMFAACRIAEPTSHPSPVSTNYENEEVVTEGDGLVLEADQAYVRDFGREPYYRGGDAGPLANENKGDWNPQRFDNFANYEVDYGIERANQNQDEQIRLNAYDNAVAYDELDNSNRADSVPELLGNIPDVSLEPEHQRYQWNPNNFDQDHDHIQPVSTEDNSCQTDGYSLQSANHFEVIIQKLMNKHGTKNILDWLWIKFNSDLKTPLNGKGTNKSREINLSRNCQSLEDLATGKEQTHNTAKNSISSTSGRLCLSHRLTTYSYLKSSNRSSFFLKYEIKKKEEENLIANKTVSCGEEQSADSLQISGNEIGNMTAVPVMSFENIILNHDYLQTSEADDSNENISDLVKTKSQICAKTSSLVRGFFEKILYRFSKKKNMASDASEYRKSFRKICQFVFKRKRDPQNCNDHNHLYPYLRSNHQIYYFHQDNPMDLQPETGNSCSYFDNHTNNCRNAFSINRCTNFSSQRTDFSNGWQTYPSPSGFLSNPEEQLNAGRSGGHQFSSTSNIAKENMEEETICLSESDSISEITPNLCCYCFQKNSIRRLASKKRDANRQDNHRTSENIKGKSGVGNITRFAGSSVDSSVHEIRKENSPFRLTNEGNLFGATSLRHRGSGDEPSQPALNTQQVPEETTRGEEDQEGRRVQKLFCCISINDTNEEALQFES